MLARAYSIEDLRRQAKRRLPRLIFDFFDGGAEDECTLRANRACFEQIRLMPRPLVDVSAVDTSRNLLGQPAALPLAIGPTGATGFGWPHADLALAKAAAGAGIPFTLSTSATVSIEDIARQAPGRLWFQAYVFRDRAFLHTLIDRARDADYEALIVTVDMPVGGKRERDFRNDFCLPFHLTARNMLDLASRPRWALRMLPHGMPEMANLRGFAPDAKGTLGVASSVGRSYDAALDWDVLAELRARWPRKFIVKGIMHPDDATRAAAMGCDGIIVSNHGGRQLDGAPPALEVLPAVRAAVGPQLPVFVDGGIRRGSDVIKALALGAEGVLLGRATLYGVSAAGQAGACRALEILSDELARSMRLCGLCSVAQIDRRVLAPPVDFFSRDAGPRTG
ncbi:MAG: alpha-hydroxy acid oxidase [Burkholderiaceae bacterium]